MTVARVRSSVLRLRRTNLSVQALFLSVQSSVDDLNATASHEMELTSASNSNLGSHIRTATAGDMTAIIPVVNSAFAIETFLEGTRTDETRMAEMMQKGEFLVAEGGDGKILASVYVECRGERGYFGVLAVDPAAQGTGLGRRMVEAAENYCRQKGCRAMDITVLSLRTDLPPFYRKLGYVETRTEEFRPSRPLREGTVCHCIVMSKAL